MELTYKTTSIINESDLQDNLLEQVVLFNNTFNKEDMYIELLDSKIICFYRTVDLQKLEDFIELSRSEPIFSNLLENIKKDKSYGVKSGKRIFVNYNKERKVSDRLAKSKKRTEGLNIAGWSKLNQEMPDQFKNKILVGNSLEILKKLPENSVDLIFTSPPYNFGLEYENQEDSHRWDDYFDKLFGIFDECIRVLKFGGRILVNVQPLFSDYIPSHHIISNFFLSRKMLWKAEILWEKNNYNCKYTAWGSWKSPSSPYLKYTWEFIEVFSKGTLLKRGDKSKIDITADEFKEYVVAKWSIAPERKMKDFGHPAMFPEKLVERVLKLFSYKGDVILDPFNGVGTTTFVAKKLDRNYLGIDISETYCSIAEKRLNEELEVQNKKKTKNNEKSLDLFSLE